jgi:hypothetical protein
MSRGLGSVQRRLLALLEKADHPLSTYELAADVYLVGLLDEDAMLSPAQVAAVSRALVALVKKGRVKRQRREHPDGQMRWGAPELIERAWKEGTSSRAIARSLGVSHVTVRKARARMEAEAAGRKG